MELRNGLKNGKHIAQNPDLPVWTRDLFRDDCTHTCGTIRNTRVETRVRHGWALIRVEVIGAMELSALDLQRRTGDAYAAISDSLFRVSASNHPVRFWNFIPDIGAPMGDGLDRYMVFNAGRFAAFHGWSKEFVGDPWTATASAVGHNGPDLVVWCLASRNPGKPVENPRQTPVRHYSDRYGPMPPSFARATILQDLLPSVSFNQANHSAREMARTSEALLIGGTASICGEQSLHEGDLAAQVDETLTNLDALVRAALVRLNPAGDQPSPQEDVFTRLSDLRVYWVRSGDRERIERLLRGQFEPAGNIEWVHADLCRPELLVEIEGVASLTLTPSRSDSSLVTHHA